VKNQGSSIVKESDLDNPRQISFILHNQMPVSILVSKKDDMKIRFQSVHYSAFWMFLKEIHFELVKKNIPVSTSGRLPSDDLKQAINEHFECRGAIKELRKTLEDRTV
jgi:hypothetical protein